MKVALASAMLLFAGLSGAVHAETPTPTCDLSVPLSDATQDCKDLRLTYAARVDTCMADMKLESQRRASSAASDNAHTSRARRLLCAGRIGKEMRIAPP